MLIHVFRWSTLLLAASCLNDGKESGERRGDNEDGTGMDEMNRSPLLVYVFLASLSMSVLWCFTRQVVRRNCAQVLPERTPRLEASRNEAVLTYAG